MIEFAIVLFGLLFLTTIGGGIAIYNALVRLRLQADGAWADIDVQLKRRHDLIPKIVDAVKGHAGFEQRVLSQVTEARAQALRSAGPAPQSGTERQLGTALHSLFAVAEAYPELRADASFRELQNAITTVEDALQNARRYYNAVVRDYNVKTQSFPSNLVARWGGFSAKDFFQLTNVAEAVSPDIKL